MDCKVTLPHSYFMGGVCGAALQIREDLDKITPKELKFPLVILGGIQVPTCDGTYVSCAVIKLTMHSGMPADHAMAVTDNF